MTVKERAMTIGIPNSNELQYQIVQRGGRVTQRTTQLWWDEGRKPQRKNRLLLAEVLRVRLSELEAWWPTPRAYTRREVGK